MLDFSHPILPRLGLAGLLTLGGVLTGAAAGPQHAPLVQRPPAAPAQPEAGIVAIVNGSVISDGDVTNRERLFALSTGMGLAPDILDRLRPQIARELIDERLRLQEVQRRRIIVPDKEIADAIHDIETRNGMPQGDLRSKLAADGVGIRTLVDQIRAQIGWTRVLREQIGQTAAITPAEVDEQLKLEQQQIGRPEYRVAEIFVPIEDPANAADAQRFAETIIKELRSGAAFPIVAAQFSQSQTALKGGDLGWVQPNQLDPEVARVAAEMPVNAVSNPLRVPGGISIITLRAKREIGHDEGTVVSVRQTFFGFSTPLDPQNPTAEQRQALNKARALANTVHNCAQMEAANKANNSSRPADPGPLRVDTLNPPALRDLLTTLPANKVSQPLVASDGIAVVIVCSRDQKNMAELNKEEISSGLLAERAELVSRQLQRELRRRSVIDVRGQKVAGD